MAPRLQQNALKAFSHNKKSFLAEVQSIGSVHHVNLVRLRGFCAWKSQRLLVYDFMSNGSLDWWIYHGVREHILYWECRTNIILDIAKGLAYLHEERIDDYNDERNLGVWYLALEWLSSVITEKVDVYSFGIVLLVILCRRKNLDRSLPEERWHLLHVFQKCWEQQTLLDMVGINIEDKHINSKEVVEMMKMALWCLQTNYTRRPSMSSVVKVSEVKVSEGGMNIESNLDYNFTYPKLQGKQ
ncbi:G-type lectin S-receptor-like serine/threonine-protein kinase SD2-5 [Bidens hawaiensis]|uniref:G-type lectin S-receptor-like serine/threonine-protein kinase SD2-5 n=1 Tax=Bidens hawaiensis TaxID=980011 RepID=UPI00404B16D7